MTRPLFAALCGALLIAMAGCKDDKADGKTGDPKGGTVSTQIGDAGLKELGKTDVKEGTGAALEKGDLALVAYTGRLKNGTVFDSNDKPDGTPFSFKVGGGGVIQGWDEGVVGMKVGGVRKLDVPSAKGYGNRDAPGGKIPANSDLFFEVKLLEMVKQGEENVWEKKELKVGTGPVAASGDTVTVHYKGTLANGRRFDNTMERNKPETFKLGGGDVITGLDNGIVGMKQGGKRWMRLPPNIAYGMYGMGVVPQDSVVFFEVELLRVQKG